MERNLLKTLPTEVFPLLDLPLNDILRLCRTERYLNDIICKNKNFWLTLASQRLSHNEETLHEMRDDPQITPKNIIDDLHTIETTNPIEWVELCARKGYEIPIMRNLANLLSFEVLRAFIIATLHGQRHIFDLLYDDPRINISIALMSAVEGGHEDLFEILYHDKRLDNYFSVFDAFTEAVRVGNRKIFDILYQDPRFDARGINILLATAAASGHDDIFDILYPDSRITPHGVNGALIAAARTGNKEIFNILYSDVRINDVGVNAAFHNAATFGQAEIFRILDRDPRITQHARDYALMEARERHHNNIVDIIQGARAGYKQWLTGMLQSLQQLRE